MGYVQTLRSGGVADVAALDYSAVDVIVHAFLSPGADGSISQLDPFDAYRQAGLATKVHAAGGKIIFSIGGSNHSSAFGGIAANATTRRTFADNVVKLIAQYGYDGVDLDYEFPTNDTEKANHLLLLQDVTAQVKAAKTSNIVVFGVSPGYFLPYFAWSGLGAASDYAFYFCYDWDADGAPMTNPGKTFMLPSGQSIERSCRGAMNFMIAGGYPASKIIVGMPFYGSGGGSWFSVRDQWAAAHWPVDPNQMQAQASGGWWTTPEALALKIDAVLDPMKTVLTGPNGKATVGGVGFWEWGHESPAHPDLSAAIKAKVK
jgi:GH18 family chitinase